MKVFSKNSIIKVFSKNSIIQTQVCEAWALESKDGRACLLPSILVLSSRHLRCSKGSKVIPYGESEGSKVTQDIPPITSPLAADSAYPYYSDSSYWRLTPPIKVAHRMIPSLFQLQSRRYVSDYLKEEFKGLEEASENFRNHYLGDLKNRLIEASELKAKFESKLSSLNTRGIEKEVLESVLNEKEKGPDILKEGQSLLKLISKRLTRIEILRSKWEQNDNSKEAKALIYKMRDAVSSNRVDGGGLANRLSAKRTYYEESIEKLNIIEGNWVDDLAFNNKQKFPAAVDDHPAFNNQQEFLARDFGSVPTTSFNPESSVAKDFCSVPASLSSQELPLPDGVEGGTAADGRFVFKVSNDFIQTIGGAASGSEAARGRQSTASEGVSKTNLPSDGASGSDPQSRSFVQDFVDWVDTFLG